MAGKTSLRMARHLDKYLYTLNDGLFFSPITTHYRPSTEFIDAVHEQLSKAWALHSSGVWCHAYSSSAIVPTQGWKIHISATPSNSISILSRVARIAVARDINFKFALDRNLLGLLSSKRWNRGGSGKFITVYPPSDHAFSEISETLYSELRSEEGPYILSDRRYKDSKVVYYRYGGMRPNATVGVTGQHIPILISPDGASLPDVRTASFVLPPWIDHSGTDRVSKNKDIILGEGRYVVESALSFSNTGGVYLATDLTSGTRVVIKEARANTAVDERGTDAIDRLRKEFSILHLLKMTGLTPQPYHLFHEWENLFLVEEHIDGISPRELALTKSPLIRLNTPIEESINFYKMYVTLFTNLAEAFSTLHKAGIILGDISHRNLRVVENSYEVKLFDLEAATRLGVDPSTFLHTPEFWSGSAKGADLSSDTYGLAALMFYMLFPLTAMSSLRKDLFGSVLDHVVRDIGWRDTPVSTVIKGLVAGDISCGEVPRLLNVTVQIEPPFTEECQEESDLSDIVAGLGSFLLSNIRLDDDDSMFPADPFMSETNPLSLGFGGAGVLYSLLKCGFSVPDKALAWIDQKMCTFDKGRLAPGLLTGSSGIAWCAWELGLEERAIEMMTSANKSELRHSHHSYLYGAAGVGLANLFFYKTTERSAYLHAAIDLAAWLLESAHVVDNGLYWEMDEIVHIGFGYGQSGVALFLHRVYEMTGDRLYATAGQKALAYDLKEAIEYDQGTLTFPSTPGDKTLLPYLEEGSAGVARTMMRLGKYDNLDRILEETHRKYSSFPGLLYGLSGFVDVLTDAAIFTGDPQYAVKARRPISGLRDLYLLKQHVGLATPGDGLTRVSCDYATGVAGVMRSIHRYRSMEKADFLLD